MFRYFQTHIKQAEGSEAPWGLKKIILKTTQQLPDFLRHSAPQAHQNTSGQSIFMAEHGCV
jgi:hypothetical protein